MIKNILLLTGVLISMPFTFAGIVQKEFTLTNLLDQAVYYQYSTVLNGIIGGVTMTNARISNRGNVSAQSRVKITPPIFAGIGDIWGDTINLHLSLDNVSWKNFAIAPGHHVIFQENDELNIAPQE